MKHTRPDVLQPKLHGVNGAIQTSGQKNQGMTLNNKKGSVPFYP
jgi:hypothetical protein